MIAKLLAVGRGRTLAVAFGLVTVIAAADWAVGTSITLEVLYILPIIIAAVVLDRWQTTGLAAICAVLRAAFHTPGSPAELAFAAFAYLLSGLFINELARNHTLAIEHLRAVRLEQSLRREAEDQLRVLVESSPAAILTVTGSGEVLAANGAANLLFEMPEGQNLQGRQIGGYLPVLAEALQVNTMPAGLRTAVQCQGRKENGEIFLAHVWFSSYRGPEGTRLAAIAVDTSEEMRHREEQGLLQLLRGNRIATAAVSHEVRNFCGAMALLCGNLSQRTGLAGDQDVKGLVNLVGGLQSIASLALESKSQDLPEPVPLQEVLDNLRILIEPDWQEIGGRVTWQTGKETLSVLAEPHGLLQAFLNLAQNSHRAVRESQSKELRITVSREQQKVVVRFHDTGSGIRDTQDLFQPFQQGAAGTGLGLYVSRSIVRSYGGELWFEPQSAGSSFALALEAV